MKPSSTRYRKSSHAVRQSSSNKGFALIATISVMVLLVMIALAMLSLSTIELRASQNGRAMAEAQANARMALMIAIGELQKEMGPDMRVSAESAILDTKKDTEAIDGVAQSHWLASYNSWGNWLNASYVHPTSGVTLNIEDTYGTVGREKMFRRWLLSLPPGQETAINAPNSQVDITGDDWVVLVGEGSTGIDPTDPADPKQHLVTRAYLNSIGENGRNAWWIGPENHKAKINMATQSRTLTNDEWETAQSDTAEVGVGALPGFVDLDADPILSDKLSTHQSLRPAGIGADLVQEHFYDLTANSQGVIASVRTGHLKKDLSLLFEGDKGGLPDLYRFDSRDPREPSIRLMSPELAAEGPKIPKRHFASWTSMRHFYRMYRKDSDAEAPSYDAGRGTTAGADKGNSGSPGLSWDVSKPWTSTVARINGTLHNYDTYTRFPILTSMTYIISLRTQYFSKTKSYGLYYMATPIAVYWNPYNVELRLPDMALTIPNSLSFSSSPQSSVQPLWGSVTLDGVFRNETQFGFDDSFSRITAGTGSEESIDFKPGEFRIFSMKTVEQHLHKIDLFPGFDPTAVGGVYSGVGGGRVLEADKPAIEIKLGSIGSGNPGSFNTSRWWTPIYNSKKPRPNMPFKYKVDWFNTSQSSTTPITLPGDPARWLFIDDKPVPVAYLQMAMKGLDDHDYGTSWEKDWRCRNWIQAPPYYLGEGLYISEDDKTANTQRINSPYEMKFGHLGPGTNLTNVIENLGPNGFMGKDEHVTAASVIELPTAPIASLAGFSGMKIRPGWTAGNTSEAGVLDYQSGITGPGIGNSFLHPIIPRTEVYKHFENSIIMEWTSTGYNEKPTNNYNSDFWDHVLLLNDTLWDDYYVSSLADQTRGANSNIGLDLSENLDRLVASEDLSNGRYRYYPTGKSTAEVKTELAAADGYLKASKHLMVNGMFNVNSTSVDAWHALFSGIRERQLVYRDKDGILKPVALPTEPVGSRWIALSRFNTATTDQEGIDPEFGITRDDGLQAWSGVRFLDNDQLRKLAEECVKQVKHRGPFLNYSEFINRRLSADDLGTMGALQSAIDYDDASPESGSINYPFKSHADFMLKDSDLGTHAFSTPEAAVGSRYAGVPGYVIQSDLLKPIANTLSVRDDTFRIRAYGDALDNKGKVLARAWCEAIVQRIPEYSDSSNDPEVPAREIGSNGVFSSIDDSALTSINRRFGRQFKIVSFRWLNSSEI